MLHKLIKWFKNRLPYNLKEIIKKVLRVSSSAHKVNVFAIVETDPDKINIAIYAGGGLGDFIVYKAVIDNLIANYECRIYLFTISYENAEAILGGIKHLHIYYPTALTDNNYFDMYLEFDYYINVKKCNITKIKQKSLKLYENINRIMTYNKTYIPTVDKIRAQRSDIIFRAKFLGLNRWTQLSCGGVFDLSGMRSGIVVDENRNEVLDRYGLRETAYITLSRGADAGFGGMRHTKLWPLYRYEEFTRLFNDKYPAITTVQLAKKGESQIGGIDLFIQDSQFEDVKVIMANSSVHIANDGGLVHTATQIGTKCIVLFGPTPEHYYGYHENANIISHTCSGCMEATDDWFINCPKGLNVPECMEEISGKMVFEIFEKLC